MVKQEAEGRFSKKKNNERKEQIYGNAEVLFAIIIKLVNSEKKFNVISRIPLSTKKKKRIGTIAQEARVLNPMIYEMVREASQKHIELITPVKYKENVDYDYHYISFTKKGDALLAPCVPIVKDLYQAHPSFMSVKTANALYVNSNHAYFAYYTINN